MSHSKRFSPVTPLTKYYNEQGWSPAKGKQIVATDPKFPRDELVQVGVNRLGITERGKAKYQGVLMERAKHPRLVSANLSNPKAAAARSAEIRKRMVQLVANGMDRAEARRVARAEASPPE